MKRFLMVALLATTAIWKIVGAEGDAEDFYFPLADVGTPSPDDLGFAGIFIPEEGFPLADTASTPQAQAVTVAIPYEEAIKQMMAQNEHLQAELNKALGQIVQLRLLQNYLSPLQPQPNHQEEDSSTSTRTITKLKQEIAKLKKENSTLSQSEEKLVQECINTAKEKDAVISQLKAIIADQKDQLDNLTFSQAIHTKSPSSISYTVAIPAASISTATAQKRKPVETMPSNKCRRTR